MRRAALMLTLTLFLSISLGLINTVNAQQTADPRVADIVRTGKLRAGVGVVAPHWAVKDTATGELRGVAVDIARELAKRLGVELVMIEYPSPPSVLDGLKTGAWDVGFLAIDPSRAALVDFSPPYLQIDATYLVQGSSPIRNVSDADQPGVRIAVTRKSVEEIVLSRMLKRAELRSVDTIPAGFELLRAGNTDALAVPRPAALQFSARLPGSRVLADRFHATSGAMAVPKGRAGWLAYISEFTEQAKASGLVQKAIEHVGVRGVQVAPAGTYPEVYTFPHMAIDIATLSPDERLKLLEQLWDSLSVTPGAVPLTKPQREELDRRLDEPDREGPVGIAWEEVHRRISGRRT